MRNLDVEGDVDIQPATEREREWAAAIMAGSDPWIRLGRDLEHCLRTCLDPLFHLYVAHRESQPVGLILVNPRGVAGSPYIASVAVAEAYRGQGIGAALVSFAEKLFVGRARYIFLCVSSFNHRARALYESLGYRQVGELPDYVVDGASEILMGKRLVKE